LSPGQSQPLELVFTGEYFSVPEALPCTVVNQAESIKTPF
jgi:hypothetical protein